MPNPKSIKLGIKLDLLRPQSNPEKILTRLFRWLLSSGRFILILVEAIVLIAFITRFKFDADLATNKETIEEQSPYIENQLSFEILARQTQLKLSTIGFFKSDYADYPQVLKKIADQTPQGVRIVSLNLERNVDKLTIQLSAIAQSNNSLASMLTGLKQDVTFSNINVTNISFERGGLNFTLSAQANLAGGKSL